MKRDSWRKATMALSMKERKHLREMKIVGWDAAERTFKDQAEWRLSSSGIEPCWECKFIAEKLGFPV